MKILIADDHAGMRSMLRSLISLALQDAAEIVECESGEQAVAMATSERPDCVLMDLELGQMSGFEAAMNGFDAARQILRQEAPAAIWMVTSYDSPAFRARAAQLGIEQFICKENLSELTPLLQTLTHPKL